MPETADAPPARRRYRRLIPRAPRSDLPPSGVYHVTVRGVACCEIFREDADRRRFTVRLKRVGKELRWTCFTYCLMTTHVHLLVSALLDDLSKGMQRTLGPYAQQFNVKYARVGHLFQDRFHVRVVRDELHFRRAYEYIRNNPVAAGMCEEPEEWPWTGSF